MTAKEQVWLTEYLQCFNATEAARRANYKHPNVQGPEKKKKFATEIKAHLEEKHMSAAEALMHVAELARGTVGPADFFVPNESGKLTIDVNLLKEYGRFIKSINAKTMRIELHSRLQALEDILKVHGKFSSDNDEPQEVVQYTPEQWQEERKKRLAKAQATAELFEESANE